jgi:hypothetical protein
MPLRESENGILLGDCVDNRKQQMVARFRFNVSEAKHKRDREHHRLSIYSLSTHIVQTRLFDS